jgi:hypothetical protein
MKATTSVLAAMRATCIAILGVPAVGSADSPSFTDWSTPVNLGPIVNSSANENTARLSPDGLSLYFASNRPQGGFGGFDLWVTRRECRSCPWQAPAPLGPNINTTGDELSPAFSHDGRLLFFSSDRPDGNFGSSDIWVTFRWNPQNDFGWVPPVNLGSSVNTMHAEFGPAFLPARSLFGRHTFYFTRAELTGDGEQDIFETRLTRSGVVSGPVTEITAPGALDGDPSLRGDGKEIVFFSQRDGSIGGSVDVWSATRAHRNSPWSLPVNLGSPVNTQFAEIGVGISLDGTELYVIKGQQLGGSGLRDIWVSTRELIEEDDD